MKKSTRIILIVVAAVLLLSLGFFLYGYFSRSSQSDMPQAYDFAVYDADGNAVKLSDYFGKPIVLNFWASWCGPCKSEMPEFDAMFRELNGAVVFLMVNMTTSGTETLETAKAYIEESGFAFPVLYDLDGNAGSAYRVTAFPTTYFIDANGGLAGRAVGAIDGATLRKGIDLIYRP